LSVALDSSVDQTRPNSTGSRSRFVHDFADGPGGWFGFAGNFEGVRPLGRRGDAVTSYGPWWIDYNHAPPHGGGYLSLLGGMMTTGPIDNEPIREYAGTNAFVEQGRSVDFTSATLTYTLRGEFELGGAEVCLLVQGTSDGVCSGWVLTGQPIKVQTEWTDHALTLEPDPSQWTSLGTRPDRAATYGHRPLADVLADVNVNLYLVLFPLDVRPKGPVEGDPVTLRPGRDYPVWQTRLPDGYLWMKKFQIDYPA